VKFKMSMSSLFCYHDKYPYQSKSALLYMYISNPQFQCRSIPIPIPKTPSMSPFVTIYTAFFPRHHASPNPPSPVRFKVRPSPPHRIQPVHDVLALSILPTLPSLSSRPCALVPSVLAVRRRAERDAASICFLVCWCMVRV
jgi:hypothetical protein